MENNQVSNFFDVIIIGGGPAGMAAAVYCARKDLKVLIITENFGGQSINSGDIQNWIGETHISGYDLAQKMEKHMRSFTNINIQIGEKVTRISTKPLQQNTRLNDFLVQTSKNEFVGASLVLAMGATRRKLRVPGEEKFEGRGVAFCSTCDAPLFKGKKVAVIGGGNAGIEAVEDLMPFASEIYLIETGKELRADKLIVDKVKQNPKLKEVLLNTKVTEVMGDQLVNGIKLQDMTNNTEKVLDVEGIFVEIGSIPNSDLVKNLVQIDAYKQIMVNCKYATTSHPGIFAAGDVTDDPYKQNNIAVGDGVRAALSAYNYLINRVKLSPAAEIYEDTR